MATTVGNITIEGTAIEATWRTQIFTESDRDYNQSANVYPDDWALEFYSERLIIAEGKVVSRDRDLPAVRVTFNSIEEKYPGLIAQIVVLLDAERALAYGNPA